MHLSVPHLALLNLCHALYEDDRLFAFRLSSLQFEHDELFDILKAISKMLFPSVSSRVLVYNLSYGNEFYSHEMWSVINRLYQV